MASFWKLAGLALLNEMVKSLAESAIEDMDPEQARVCRKLLKLYTAITKIGFTSWQVSSVLQHLARFLNGDKASLGNGLGAVVQSMLVSKSIFEGYEEVQELIDEIKGEWDRYEANRKSGFIEM